MKVDASFGPTGQLNGKSVVVVGGSSGIGLAVALQARAQGAKIFLVGRGAEKLRLAIRSRARLCVLDDEHVHDRPNHQGRWRLLAAQVGARSGTTIRSCGIVGKSVR